MVDNLPDNMKHLFTVLMIGVCACAYPQASKVITTTLPKDLIPEGIAVDPASGLIYISSIVHHKIVTIDASGRSMDFIRQDQDGFLEGLGMKVDPERKQLWALSNVWEKAGTAQLHVFDLSKGKTVKRFHLPDAALHGFNDLVLDGHGKAYITDTSFGAVYEADIATGKLTLLVKDSLTKYPNGIALGNAQLYIATYSNGILRYDLKKKELSRVAGARDSLTDHNLDGLVLFKNSLIGIANGDSPDRNVVVRYFLDPTGARIVDERTIDRANPSFKIPTTLALSGQRIYVLANSNLDAYNANNQSAKGIEEKLTTPVVLVYDLE